MPKKVENTVSDAMKTDVSTLDHVSLIEASSYDENQSKKFRANVIISEKDAKVIEQQLLKISKEQFGDVDKSKLDGWALKFGDDEFFSNKEKPENSEYLRGKYWIVPQRVEKLGRPPLFSYDFSTKSKIRITTEEEIEEKFYRGAKVIPEFVLSTFKVGNKKGTTCYLNSLLFVKDGERMTSAGSVFDDLELTEEETELSDTIGDSI